MSSPSANGRGRDASDPYDESARFLLICPTHRDLRELERIGIPRVRVLTHEYASDTLERLAGAVAAPAPTISDPVAEVETIVSRFGGQRLAGVISADDYPGSTLASIVARRLGLAGPSPAVNLLLQHKLQARRVQLRLTPDATPAFAAVPPDGTPPLPFPFFVKPVKSFFSIGAQVVRSMPELEAWRSQWSEREAFFQPFEQLLETFGEVPLEPERLLAEGLLYGRQVTLEGYARGGEMGILGIVDSVFVPGTLAFERFDYPSTLPHAVQARMAEIAQRLLGGLGFEDSLFNIEFVWDPKTGRIGIVEVNPRIASQFADLYEKVDGFNSYEVLLDLATGRRPTLRRRQGRHAFAASCVLRTFEDAHVANAPDRAALDRVAARWPDARVEVLVETGQRLSDEMQDGTSYRFGVINLGGPDLSAVQAALAECETLLGFDLRPLQRPPQLSLRG